MQNHFLSDVFFNSLRSVRFTDRSGKSFLKQWHFCFPPSLWLGKEQKR
ncbi:MAG: hypothetical protein LBR79_07470 [Oscillospiraceae bacterium]|nr:hypothetical protein [Oscillospiraceae bacterium]